MMNRYLRAGTERRDKEDGGEQSHRLQFLLAAGPAVIYACEVADDLRFTFVSENVVRQLGYEARDFLDDPGFWLRRVHPDDVQRVCWKHRGLSSNERLSFEYRFLHGDGTYHWIYGNMTLAEDPAGRPLEIIGFWIDITGRKQVEEALRSAQEQVRKVLVASPAMIYSLKVEGERITPTWVSGNVRPLLGYEPEEPLDRTWWKTRLHPDDAATARERQYRELLSQGMLVQEYRFLHKDGRYIWLRDHARVVAWQDGKPAEVVGSWTDVSQLKQAEEALWSAEQQFRAVFEAAEDGILVTDEEGRYVNANPAACQIFGVPSVEEFRTLSVRDFVGPERFEPLWARFRETGRDEGQLRLRRRDGSTVQVEYTANYGVMPGRHLAIVRDITERLRVLEAEARLARILDETPDFVATLTLEQLPVYLNRASRWLFGIGEDQDISSLRLADYRPAWAERRFQEEAVPAALRDGVWSGESALFGRNGEEIPVHQVVLVHEGVSGGERYISRISRDIRDLKRAEHALLAAKEQAEQASRAKSEFLSNMSHELRTPLNSVIGFSEMLLDGYCGELNGRQRQYLENSLAAGRHLLSLINDILDLTKIEAGRAELELLGIDLGPLLADIVASTAATATRHEIDLQLRVGGPLPVRGDPRRIKQIVLNLLSNAIKFTPRGGQVRVEADLRQSIAPSSGPPLAGPWVCIAVADTGIGIDPADQERLFHLFEQVDSSHSRRQQGTGLGLALTRKLTDLHKGHAWVESEGLGCGSTFHVAFPMVLCPEGIF